jgi:hypothetical protein
MTITGTGANIIGTANISGNANVGNIGATNGVFTNVSGNGSSLSSIAGANVTGTVANATYATTAGSVGSATTAGTVTTNAQPNITSTGTLASLSVTGNANIGNIGTGGLITATGNITGGNVIANSYHIRSVNAAVSAAGTTQGTGTALTREFNRVSTVASGAGVVLPTAVAGMAIVITNTSANSLLVYPASGAQINALAANVAYTQTTLATLQYVALTATQWYTVGATYS